MGRAVSRSFEIRHVTLDPAANGESDFTGPAAALDTEQRIGFLSAFAAAARRFFKQAHWDAPAVPSEQVEAALASLKPQPLPGVRRVLTVNRWRWLGHKEGAESRDSAKIERRRKQPGLIVRGDGVLGFSSPAAATFTFTPQDWRFLVRMRVRRAAEPEGPVSVAIGDVLRLEGERVGWRVAGLPSVALAKKDAGLVLRSLGKGGCRVAGRSVTGDACRAFAKTATGGEREWSELRVEVALDAEAAGANVYLDGSLCAGAVPVEPGAVVDRIVVTGSPGWELGECWVQSYADAGAVSDRTPISMTTVLDETFRLRPSVEGWNRLDYDDGNWPEADAPFAHGGERHAGEDLYLRHRFGLGVAGRVWLRGEMLFPGGEIWVNGRIAAVRHKPMPFNVDITPFVRFDADNLLAIRVNPFRVERLNAHGCPDLNSGWFAGRCRIETTGEGREVARHVVRGIELAAGRTVARLAPWRPERLGDGFYGFEYEVRE